MDLRLDPAPEQVGHQAVAPRDLDDVGVVHLLCVGPAGRNDGVGREVAERLVVERRVLDARLRHGLEGIEQDVADDRLQRVEPAVVAEHLALVPIPEPVIVQQPDPPLDLGRPGREHPAVARDAEVLQREEAEAARGPE